MSFYRIYRPQTIDEIDNAAVREALLSLLRKDRRVLPHAFLFSGSKGTGKTTAARLVAKIFNCTKISKADGPCGKCEQCKAIAAGTNMDILEIDAASNRGIDEMRTLRERIALAPSASEFKVYIIDEVHMLTTEAFNALLKTLEEPPAHAVFVLATTDPQKVPATIVSRCVHITFSRAGSEELLAALRRIVRKEKIDIDKDALSRIADLADGSFRDAVKILEQASLYKGKITPAAVEKLVSAATSALTAQFVVAVWAGEAQKAIALVEEFVAGGGDVKSFLQEVLSYLHDRMIETVKDPKIQRYPPVDTQRRVMAALIEAYGQMRQSPIAHLPLELAVIGIAGTNEEPVESKPEPKPEPEADPLGLLTLEKLTEHWLDFIAATKPYNNSVSGFLRSARPARVSRGIVTITAFYPFHKEKLSEIKTREVLGDVLKKLFGETVKVEVELGKKGA